MDAVCTVDLKNENSPISNSMKYIFYLFMEKEKEKY